MLCAVLFMGLYGLILTKAFQFDVIYWYGAVYGVLGAGASILGGSGFSAIKRQMNIKDYGDLIPGHGGILDRFDSMMLVAPLVELLLRMLPYGGGLVLVPLVAAFCSDSAALFTGMACGKHKLSPLVSPHKTVEGAVGALSAVCWAW